MQYHFKRLHFCCCCSSPSSLDFKICKWKHQPWNKHRPHMFLAHTLVVPSLRQQEKDWRLIPPPQRNAKAEPEEGYDADATQQPKHIKASPLQAEHAVVCRRGIGLFLCNTQMIKEFNTASRLMTPLGCRRTQERRRRGLQRILTKTGRGSKIYKFIHQNGVFSTAIRVGVCVCVCVSTVFRWQTANVRERVFNREETRKGRWNKSSARIIKKNQH